MTKTTKIILIVASLLLVINFLLSYPFNIWNFGGYSNQPYLIKATVVELTPEQVTFSEIHPFVIMDKSHVIAALRNRHLDPNDLFRTMPSSDSTFWVSRDQLPDLELNEIIWLKFYPPADQFEVAFARN